MPRGEKSEKRGGGEFPFPPSFYPFTTPFFQIQIGATGSCPENFELPTKFAYILQGGGGGCWKFLSFPNFLLRMPIWKKKSKLFSLTTLRLLLFLVGVISPIMERVKSWPKCRNLHIYMIFMYLFLWPDPNRSYFWSATFFD